ncbi:heavy-metal-associated domain-containing protein [Xanthomarina sp.]|uniref:heavy-metal-associated domain-containing protein n=1 Tax=Xanthomarina sp. TaxID=1931211 RepID=UPI002D0D1E9E|nr:heavy-metal-associated domain-containing protein [Xanthomarina sp.]HLV39830.1 hypothetical protein [Xanthomarina sp.]
MSFLSENVIPGNHGKIFGTDATDSHDLERIKHGLLKIEGVKDVLLNTTNFVKEFTVFTSKTIEVKTIQDKVKSFGFHAIPKGIFPL